MYREIVFLTGEEAEPYLDDCSDWPVKVIQSLREFEGATLNEEEPWGDADETYKWGVWVLSWNRGLGYVSLTEVVK